MLLPVVWVAAVNYLLVDRQILCNKAGQCIQIQNSWLFFSEQCAYLYTTALSLSINQSDWHFLYFFWSQLNRYSVKFYWSKNCISNFFPEHLFKFSVPYDQWKIEKTRNFWHSSIQNILDNIVYFGATRRSKKTRKRKSWETTDSTRFELKIKTTHMIETCLWARIPCVSIQV